MINVDFPLPDTPVTHVKVPNGTFKSTCCKLCPLAPLRSRFLPFPFLLDEGTFMLSSPFKYRVVKESLEFNSDNFPAFTISPPCTPAPGPISTIKSAASIISRSCSTTMTELPASRNRFKELINRVLSRWCNPMEGSSRMYKTFINSEPICVANRIRCASPPESVLADR